MDELDRDMKLSGDDSRWFAAGYADPWTEDRMDFYDDLPEAPSEGYDERAARGRLELDQSRQQLESVKASTALSKQLTWAIPITMVLGQTGFVSLFALAIAVWCRVKAEVPRIRRLSEALGFVAILSLALYLKNAL